MARCDDDKEWQGLASRGGPQNMRTLGACFLCENAIEEREPFRLSLVVIKDPDTKRQTLANVPSHVWCEIYAVADEVVATEEDDDDVDPEERAREFVADLVDSLIRPPKKPRSRRKR